MAALPGVRARGRARAARDPGAVSGVAAAGGRFFSLPRLFVPRERSLTLKGTGCKGHTRSTRGYFPLSVTFFQWFLVIRPAKKGCHCRGFSLRCDLTEICKGENSMNSILKVTFALGALLACQLSFSQAVKPDPAVQIAQGAPAAPGAGAAGTAGGAAGTAGGAGPRGGGAPAPRAGGAR